MVGLRAFTTQEYLSRPDRRCLDQLKLDAQLPKGYTLGSEFRYRTNIGPERVIVVPEGFPTDLASIPRAVRSLVPKDGPNRWAAIVHDYLYSLKGGGPYLMSRKDADKIFMEAMIDVGVGRIKRNIMYRAVRLGGWAPWKRKPRPEDPTYQDWRQWTNED